jgi:hypothetical protein
MTMHGRTMLRTHEYPLRQGPRPGNPGANMLPEALDRPRPLLSRRCTGNWQHNPAQKQPIHPVYSMLIPPLQPNRSALPPRAGARLYIYSLLVRKCKFKLDSCRKPRCPKSPKTLEGSIVELPLMCVIPRYLSPGPSLKQVASKR